MATFIVCDIIYALLLSWDSFFYILLFILYFPGKCCADTTRRSWVLILCLEHMLPMFAQMFRRLEAVWTEILGLLEVHPQRQGFYS